MSIHRRDVLKVAGISMAAGAAGCLGSDDGDGNGGESGPPTYTQWLTTDDEGGVGYVYLDWATFEDGDSENESDSEEDGELDEKYQNDPMIGVPMTGVFSAAFVGIALGTYGLDGMLDTGDSDDGEDLNSTAETMLIANQVIVVTGDLDTDEVDEKLTAEPEDMFKQQYEQGDETGGYDIYTPVDGDDDAIAVSDSEIIFVADDDVDDAVGAVETAIEAAAGDTERATEESEDFEWLVSTAGDGTIAYGGYGNEFETDPEDEEMDGSDGDSSDPDYSELEGLEGGVSSLTINDDESASGEFAAILGDADASALEDSLGSSADESSVDVDDDRVTASASWDAVE